MKFALRRRDPGPEQADTPPSEAGEVPDAAPEPPHPPTGAAVAVYAEVLDGRTLWLAVEAQPGRLALRPAGGGDPVPLVSDLVEDDPAYRSVRADLLPVTEDGSDHDVVLVPPGGRPARPVWIAPDLDRGPVVVPAVSGEDIRLDLTRTEEGLLRLSRRAVPAGYDLEGVTESAEALVLEVRRAGSAPAPVDGELLLVGEDGPLARFPAEPADDTGRVRAAITLADLPAGATGRTRVAFGTAADWHPVRRRHHDLAAADDAVLLPALMGDDPERPRLKLQWRRGGQLHAKLIRADTAGGADTTGEDDS